MNIIPVKPLAIACLLALGTLSTHAAPDTNLFPEGTFAFGLNSKNAPVGWEIEPGNYKATPGASVEIVKEEGENFVRLANKETPLMLRLIGVIPLPQPAPAQLTLSWRARVTEIERPAEPEWASIGMDVCFVNAAGEEFEAKHGVFRFKLPTGDWVEGERMLAVPAGAVSVKVMPGLYVSKGQLDLADFKVVPVVPNK